MFTIIRIKTYLARDLFSHDFYQFEIVFLPQTMFKRLRNGLLSINGKLGQIIMLVMNFQQNCCWEKNWNKQLTRETTNKISHKPHNSYKQLPISRYLDIFLKEMFIRRDRSMYFGIIIKLLFLLHYLYRVWFCYPYKITFTFLFTFTQHNKVASYETLGKD